MKKFIAIALSAFLLAGCSNNTTNESTNSAASAEISSETTSSVTESSSESVSTSVEESSSSTESSSVTVESSSSVSSSSTTEKPAESSSNSSSSSSSSSTKPVEKPVSSSTSSSSTNKPTSSSTTKIEEKPIHTHSFTEATCTNPATCISCGETKGTTINHNYNNGSCIYCGKNDPNYVAPHNCKNDGHIWNNSYTESSTENVEIVETHLLSANGYDYDLAERYFGRGSSDTHFSDIFGCEWGSGSSKVKTTGVKTITRFIHECSECGYKEVYNTEETVTPDDNWVFVNKPRSEYFPLIWWDINNIPDEVYEGVEKEQKAFEEWKNSL
ncbi:MAG: hypothetical protein MSR67_03800 [Oscillospiraceae bacterium]|nr:hypothetical protein [Oscillospiraceae bacterium]